MSWTHEACSYSIPEQDRQGNYFFFHFLIVDYHILKKSQMKYDTVLKPFIVKGTFQMVLLKFLVFCITSDFKTG